MKLLTASVFGLLLALAAGSPLSRQMIFEPVPLEVTPAPVVEPVLPPPSPAAAPVGPAPRTGPNAPAPAPAQPEIVVSTPEPLAPVVLAPAPATPAAVPARSVGPTPIAAIPIPTPTAIAQPAPGMVFEPPANTTLPPPTNSTVPPPTNERRAAPVATPVVEAPVVEVTPLPPVVVTMPDIVPPVDTIIVSPAPVSAIPPRRTPAVAMPTPALFTGVAPSPDVIPELVPVTPAPIAIATPIIEVTPVPVLTLPSPSVSAAPSFSPLIIPEPSNIAITLPTAEPLVDTAPNSPFGAFPEASQGAVRAAACFPASATVALADGSVKRMDAVKIGDNVAVGNGKFSPVFMFTHKLADGQHSFVEIAAAGKTLRLTDGHYMYVNGRLAAARTAKAGDIVSVDGSDATISSVRTVQDVGLYNPQTEHGDVLVGGFAASTYTEAVHPSAAHALLAPLRALYAKLAFSTKMVDSGADALAQCMPKGQAVF